MRIGYAFALRPWLRVRRAVFLGALLLCITAFPVAADEHQMQVAAVPPGSAEIGYEANLPRILSTADATRYRQIFALQEAGDLAPAAALIKALENPVLLGHVEAQKYLHPTAHRSSFHELKAWLESYADHPQARRIYRLAMRRKPADHKAPNRPIAPPSTTANSEPPTRTGYISPLPRSRAKRRALINILVHIRKHIRRGQLTHAREHLVGPKLNRLADDVELDIIRAEVAYGFFIQGSDEIALALGDEAARRSGDYATLGSWAAGLAAYRLGELETARRQFEALASAGQGPAALIAGGAYWASRLNLITRRPERVSRYLKIAADHPRSFYGLLANRALGQEIEFAWEPPTLTERELATVMSIPEAVRALALTEIREISLAEAEIRRLRPENSPVLGRAMLALATRIGLPATQLRVARTLSADDGRRHDGGLYPLPTWVPENGYTVDRALLFAFMRQESAFNVRAKSHAGARGLMQLMPRTASFVARDNRIHRSREEFLFRPEFNIELGQKYVLLLLSEKTIDNNLLLAVAAYNGGPGNLRKWLRRTEFLDDPLLFKESLPARETRDFIEKVFTNLWIYRARLNQDAPTLDAVSGGLWPAYTPRDPAAIAQLEKLNGGN